MIPRIIAILISSLFLWLLPAVTYSWNASGHKLVAQIAYKNISKQTQKRVDHLLIVLNHRYPGTRYMTNAAVLLDWLKYRNIKDYDTWHYIDWPYQPKGSFAPLKPQGDALNAIQLARQTLTNPGASEIKKAFALSVLLHVVGDIHQPLHSISLYSQRFPQGDRGGNLYRISHPHAKNLHALWDAGFYFYIKHDDSNHKKRRRALRYPQIRNVASSLQRKYPRKSVQSSLQVTDPKAWAKESYSIARRFAYSTPLNKRPSMAYERKGKEITQRRITLAGYRLAKLLNTIFSSHQTATVP